MGQIPELTNSFIACRLSLLCLFFALLVEVALSESQRADMGPSQYLYGLCLLLCTSVHVFPLDCLLLCDVVALCMCLCTCN